MPFFDEARPGVSVMIPWSGARGGGGSGGVQRPGLVHALTLSDRWRGGPRRATKKMLKNKMVSMIMPSSSKP